MKNPFLGNIRVRCLTSTALALVGAIFSSCSYVRHSAYDAAGELCTTRAFVQNDIPSFLKQRFGSQSQVRTAVLPFSVPANFAGLNPESDFGVFLAKEMQATLLQSQLLPLVEVAFRPDWPGKQAEFFAGNYGTMQLARDAGYDLVLVGLVEKESGPERLVASTKLIEVESGITVWYGQTKVVSNREDVQKTSSFFGLESRTPNYLPVREMARQFLKCTVAAMDPQEP